MKSYLNRHRRPRWRRLLSLRAVAVVCLELVCGSGGMPMLVPSAVYRTPSADDEGVKVGGGGEKRGGVPVAGAAGMAAERSACSTNDVRLMIVRE